MVFYTQENNLSDPILYNRNHKEKKNLNTILNLFKLNTLLIYNSKSRKKGQNKEFSKFYKKQKS